MMQIIIGKEGNQPFQIGDPKVSRQHAILNIDEVSKQMQLIDNNSTNGTYVYNGSGFVRLYANQPYPVTFDTMIQLGTETRFHVRRLFQQANSVAKKPKDKEIPKPKKVDIKGLRRVSEHYSNEKIRLDSKMNGVNGLRSGTIIISLLSGTGGKLLAYQLLGEEAENAEVYSWLLGVGLAAVLFFILWYSINQHQSKIIRQRTQNEHDYAVKYCCPECHTSFKGKVYENILAEGRCPKCKAEYYESKN